eukprot:TRINITY_DN2943_c0_g1_i1.p1 TRINITY_DN2943_c0_g1~~TRINITY_DN2943_c0_g1_i1.p1  ORF type:complete len:168 (-),score=40.40 TRINITY_DN2943_c0_g1_i1:14-451(-)
MDLKSLPMKERIKIAIKTRLEFIIPYINGNFVTWPQALALLAQPSNIPSSILSIAILSDELCFLCGDQSIDMSWYFNRFGLAGIYAATEIYMLTDRSDSFKDTWDFLDRSIEDAIYLINKQAEIIRHLSYLGQLTISNLNQFYNK